MPFDIHRRFLPLFCIFLSSIASCGKDGPTEPETKLAAHITLSATEATLTAVG